MELAHLKVMWNIRYGGLAAGQIADVINAQDDEVPPSRLILEKVHFAHEVLGEVAA